jgi:DNA adenine methylase
VRESCYQPSNLEEDMSDSGFSTVPLGEESIWDALASEAKPFLRWAGGKGWLLPLLKEQAPRSFKAFFEPFLGSGAVLLSVSTGVKRKASDLNAELINAFEIVRDNPSSLIARLRSFGYSKSDYLEARICFNELKRDAGASPDEKAALFIYLNKTSFNGLYRENARGDFNVPWGKKTKAPVHLEELILRASKNLRGQDSTSRAEFEVGDYLGTLRKAGPGDWIYLDPPYSPLSKTANFVGYTAGGFGAEQQTLLRDEAEAAVERGALVLLSNADTVEVRELYSERKWHHKEISVSRSVGALRNTRKKVPELLVKSYD